MHYKWCKSDMTTCRWPYCKPVSCSLSSINRNELSFTIPVCLVWYKHSLSVNVSISKKLNSITATTTQNGMQRTTKCQILVTPEPSNRTASMMQLKPLEVLHRPAEKKITGWSYYSTSSKQGAQKTSFELKRNLEVDADSCFGNENVRAHGQRWVRYRQRCNALLQIIRYKPLFTHKQTNSVYDNY